MPETLDLDRLCALHTAIGQSLDAVHDPVNQHELAAVPHRSNDAGAARGRPLRPRARRSLPRRSGGGLRVSYPAPGREDVPLHTGERDNR